MTMLVVVLACVLGICSGSAPSKYSTRSQIFRWDVGLSGVDGTLAAFTDFNNDKYADMVIFTPNPQVPAYTDVKIFIWSKKSYSFGLLDSITVPLTVVNIIPSDFNKDGSIDLLVQGTSESSSNNQFISQIYLGYANKIDDQPCQDVQIISDGQVLLFDYNSDMRSDLLGSTDNSTRTVWQNVPSTDSNCGFKFQPIQWTLSSGITHYSLANSFTDIDGDCLSDLFLSSEVDSQTVYELFLNQKGSWANHKWSNSYQHFTAPPGAGIVSFFDVDGDGNVDAVFPVCSPSDTCTQSSIHIIYNSQKTICTTSKESPGCRSLADLCQSDPNFQMGSVRNSEDYVITVLPNQRDMRFTTSTDISNFFFRVQPGDIDLDGYPDLLVFVSYVNGGQRQNGVIALRNVPCDSENCSPEAISSGRRYFSKMNAATTGDLESVQFVRAGAFFDLDDDGTQDIILSTVDPVSNSHSTVVLVNNFNEDAFFLKAIGLNGVCPSHCTNGVSFPNPKVRSSVDCWILFNDLSVALWSKSSWSSF
jgi:integrin alpha FG-GAP repeat containing protein 1